MPQSVLICTTFDDVFAETHPHFKVLNREFNEPKLERIVHSTEKELLAVRNIGPKSRAAIIQQLKQFGLKLRDPEVSRVEYFDQLYDGRRNASARLIVANQRPEELSDYDYGTLKQVVSELSEVMLDRDFTVGNLVRFTLYEVRQTVVNYVLERDRDHYVIGLLEHGIMVLERVLKDEWGMRLAEEPFVLELVEIEVEDEYSAQSRVLIDA